MTEHSRSHSLDSDHPINVRILSVSDVYQMRYLPSLSTLIQKVKLPDQPGNYNVFLFPGDFLAPSVMSSIDHGKSMVECMNALGVDFVCFGNHEADVPLSSLAERIGESRFKWINSNMAGLPIDHGNLVPYIVKDFSNGKHERSVLLMGLLSPDPGLYKSGAFGGAVISDPVEASMKIDEELAKLQIEVDLWLPLTHQSVGDDRKYVAKLSGGRFGSLPLVFGAHEHQPILESSSDYCQIAKSGMDAANVVVADIVWHSSDVLGSEPTVTASLRTVTRYPPDPHMAKLVHGLEEHAYSKYRKCELIRLSPSHTLNSKAVRMGSNSVGRLFCDFIRAHFAADCCIVQSGSIRRGHDYDEDRPKASKVRAQKNQSHNHDKEKHVSDDHRAEKSDEGMSGCCSPKMLSLSGSARKNSARTTGNGSGSGNGNGSVSHRELSQSSGDDDYALPLQVFTLMDLVSELPFNDDIVAVNLPGYVLLETVREGLCQRRVGSGGFLQHDTQLKVRKGLLGGDMAQGDASGSNQRDICPPVVNLASPPLVGSTSPVSVVSDMLSVSEDPSSRMKADISPSRGEKSQGGEKALGGENPDSMLTIDSVYGNTLDPNMSYRVAVPLVLLEGVDDFLPLVEWSREAQGQPEGADYGHTPDLIPKEGSHDRTCMTQCVVGGLTCTVFLIAVQRWKASLPPMPAQTPSLQLLLVDFGHTPTWLAENAMEYLDFDRDGRLGLDDIRRITNTAWNGLKSFAEISAQISLPECLNLCTTASDAERLIAQYCAQAGL